MTAIGSKIGVILLPDGDGRGFRLPKYMDRQESSCFLVAKPLLDPKGRYYKQTKF